MRYRILALLVAYLIVLLTLVQFGIGRIDSDTYWVGARLWLSGRNPYDQDANVELFKQLGTFDPNSMMHFFLPPPQALSLIGLFASWEFIEFTTIFLVLSLLGVFLAVISGWWVARVKQGAGESRLPLVAVLFASLPLFPVVFLPKLGQISALVLLFLSIFIFLSTYSSRLVRLLTGVFFSLVVIKPNLIPIVLLYVIIVWLRGKRISELLGFLLGLGGISYIPWLFQPEIYLWYAHSEKPFVVFNSCIGAWIQSLSPENWSLRFLPLAIAVLCCLYFWLKKRIEFSWDYFLLVVIPLNVVVSPYVWVYDFALLIPSLSYLAWIVASSRSPGSVKIIAGIIVLNTLMHITSNKLEYLVWYPLVVLGMCGACFVRRAKTNRLVLSQDSSRFH